MNSEQDIRRPAVAGYFYPSNPKDLRNLVRAYLEEVRATPQTAVAAIVPHAGLIYSGQCAAHVFQRIAIPDDVILLGPNHHGAVGGRALGGMWSRGAFETPVGRVAVAEDLAEAISTRCELVAHDPLAHAREHSLEVELPLLLARNPEARIVPILLAWDEWSACRELATALAAAVREWPGDVLLVASSDMTHYESADHAAAKDEKALAHVASLDGEGLLRTCKAERITMCGRAPAATVLEAARQLGARSADVVDYRHSGWVTGDDSQVVAYAGVVVT